MGQTTHQWDKEGDCWRQIVSPEQLRRVLDLDGDDYERPDDFGPRDEWDVGEGGGDNDC